MRHTKDQHQRWWHVRHRLRPSRPTNEFFVLAVKKGPPRKCSRFSGADRFSPCRLHAAIYEPIVYYLGIAGGIVKRDHHRPGVAARILISSPPTEAAYSSFLGWFCRSVLDAVEIRNAVVPFPLLGRADEVIE